MIKLYCEAVKIMLLIIKLCKDIERDNLARAVKIFDFGLPLVDNSCRMKYLYIILNTKFTFKKIKCERNR